MHVHVSLISLCRFKLYLPLIGLINLFLHISQHPGFATARSDVLLLETIVGHFSYLEYGTRWELGSTFARKIVGYIRSRVERAHVGVGRNQVNSSGSASTTRSTNGRALSIFHSPGPSSQSAFPNLSMLEVGQNLDTQPMDGRLIMHS